MPRQRSTGLGRDFNIFWAGQGLSVFGDAFAIIATPLLVLDATGSVASMGRVTAVFGVGQLLAGIVAGPIVDRVDRRRLMVRCDVARVLLYAAVPLGWWLLGPQTWLLYAVTFGGGVFAMLFGVAYVTAVANLVDRDRITDANGRLQATFATAFVLGPMLAGIVSDRVGAANAIGINAVSFGVSAASLAMVRLRRAAAERSVAERGDVHALLVGARFLWRDPIFRVLTLLIGGIAFVSIGATDLFIYYLKEDLGQGDGGVGVVFGIASVGSVLGGVLVARLRRRWGFGPCFVGAFFVQGVAMAAVGVAPSLVLVAVLAVAYTFAESMRGITSMSLRQELTPDHLLGRVTAAFWMVFNVPGPIGAVALTALGQRLGASAALAIARVLAVLLGLVALLGPARARHPEIGWARRQRSVVADRRAAGG